VLPDAKSDHSEEIAISELIAGPIGVWHWDLERKVLHADSRFAELHGLDPYAAAQGLAPKVFFDLIHPDDQMRVRIAVVGVIHGVEVFQKQYRLKTPEGGVRWVSALGRAQRADNGKATVLSGVVTDISAQKNVEERLRVAQSAGGVGTFEYISGFGTVHVSEQFCRLLDLSPSDQVALRAVNSRFGDASSPFFGGSGDEPEGEIAYREFEIVQPDSGATRWIAQRGEVRHDGPAGGLRYIGVIYDVTAIKKVEAKLRELTVFLGARVAERTRDRDRMWNNSRDLLAVMDLRGFLLAVNPSWTRVLGYHSEDLVDKDFRTFVAAEDCGNNEQALLEMASAGNLDNFTNRCRRQDGEYRWISWHTSLEDRLIYMFGRDITEEKAKAEALKQTEDQLRQAQKMEAIGQLTGGIAHDFNNMLMSIMGGLDLVRRRLEQGRPDEVQHFIDAAMTSARRAAGLTQRLLAFARQQSLDPKAIDVEVLLRSMQDLLTRALGEQIELKMALDSNLWAALSDTNQLENAVLNLAINARDAMSNGGSLLIRAENVLVGPNAGHKESAVSDGDYVLITVTDTGHGMSPDVVSKAFDPFFTTKPIGEGTGLGLSMVYGFIRQMGGYVVIGSSLGAGTSVKMYLPRASEKTSAQQEGRSLGGSDVQGAGQTILIVEDEAAVRGLMVELLKDLGYRVLEASDANAAIKHLASASGISLLITDVGLPGMSGRQLAEIARADQPQLRVLFVTGYAAGATIRSEFLKGGMEMIAKPFSLDVFADKIHEMLKE
jgi:PAS domain S-box-containing protein